MSSIEYSYIIFFDKISRKKFLVSNLVLYKQMLTAADLLLLVITGLISLFPVSRIVKYRDKKKGEGRD
jgi:hypothetical protein